MNTIERVEKNLKNNYFASSQFETIGTFFVYLCYKNEAEKAEAI